MSFKTTFTLSEVYNKQLSGIWPTAFYDYFEKTSLLIGTNETTFITDASTNNWTLTPAAVRANNEHPHQPGYYSTYFATSADYVTTSAIFMSATSFTVECWVNTVNKTAYAGICKNGAAADWTVTDIFVIGLDSSGNSIWIYGASGTLTLNGTMTVTDGKWHHVAFVYDGTNYKLYIDGILNVSQALAAMSQTARVHNIGSDIRSARSWVGHISNFRVVNGTALYSSNFVPPTSPLTAIPGTAILTCMDSYHAERKTPFTMTSAGVPSIRSFTPFSSTIPSTYSTYGSAYLNTSGLSNAAFTGANFGTSADFTIESWMKWGATAAGNQTSYEFNGTTRTIIGRSSTGLRLYLTGTEKGFAYTFIPNVWYHIAIVRSLLTYYVYINGVLATAAFTLAANHSYTTLTIGRNYDNLEPASGLSLSNFRVVNGTAVYGGNFIPPTEPLTAIPNTTLLTLQNDKEIVNSKFYDDSSMKNLITAAGTPTQGTFSPISANGWSTYVDTAYQGIGGAVSLIAASVTTFTAECWIYMTAAPASTDGVPSLIGMDAELSTSVYLGFGPNASRQLVLRWFDGGSKTATGATVIALNTWVHIAVVSNNNTISMYVNGVAETLSGTTTLTARNSTVSKFALFHNSSASAYQFKGYASSIRVVNGTAVYTSAFTPQTLPLTAIPGTVLLTCQDNRFKDNSINAFALTVVSTPSIQPFSPFYPSQKTIGTTVDYVGNSNYFPTTSDYLTVSMGDGQMFRTSDFTVEMWVYNTGTAHNLLMAATGTTSWSLLTFSSQLYWQQNGSNLVNVGSIVLNAWSHFAVCRVSGVLKAYINGVLLYSAANTYDYTNSSTARYIGPTGGSAVVHISNVRVVNGTAVYTTSFFTPPTAPLTAIPGTVLLTCQDSLFRDNSVNALTITRTGSPQISPVTPFTATTSTSYDILDNGSMYLSDATIDYMTLPSSSTAYNFAANVDFTFEAWVYPTEYLSGGWGIFDARVAGASAAAYIIALMVVSGTYRLNFYNAGNNNGSTIINLNTWTHVAVVRSGTFLRLYVNGVLDTSFSAYGTAISPGTTAPYIGTKDVALTGHGTSGYISNLRLVNGTALYLSSFAPSTVLRDVPGTVLFVKGNNAGIYDATGRNNLITLGDAKTSQVNKKYGNNSLYFDGTGDYLKSPFNSGYSLPGDFTVEAWIYLTSAAGTGSNQTIVSFGYNNSTGAGPWGFYLNGAGPYTLYFNSTTGNHASSATIAIPLSTWTHVTYSRNGTSGRFFVNGTQIGTIISDAFAYTGTTESLFVGIMSDASTAPFNGYIDDLRITKGVARYITSFTPPPRLGLVP